MENTMRDLQDVVAEHIYQTMHGREINDSRLGPVLVPHMLGITPIGKTHDEDNERDTILDPEHEFWQTYIEDVDTRALAMSKIITAIKLLKDHDTLNITYPDGVDGDIMYVEVEPPNEDIMPPAFADPQPPVVPAECVNCGQMATARVRLVPRMNGYNARYSVYCSACDTTGMYSVALTRE